MSVDQFSIADQAITFRDACKAHDAATARCDRPGGDPALHAVRLHTRDARGAAQKYLFEMIDAFKERHDG